MHGTHFENKRVHLTVLQLRVDDQKLFFLFLSFSCVMCADVRIVNLSNDSS